MSELDVCIRGADVVTPTGVARLEVGLVAGKIAAVAPTLAAAARETIDGTGGLLVPGMVDAHVHFNEPGRTDWEGFATGSRAAAAGGVTTVFDMPLNSSPATLTPEAFAEKRTLANAKSIVHVRLWGGLTPINLDQLEALHACGVVGFKAFMSGSGIDEFPRADPTTLRTGMKTVARLPGMRVAVHAEDETLTAQLASAARAAGRTDARGFCASRPIEAELRAIRDILELSGETGCPVHVVHVSSADGLALITEAKRRGVDVTAETCPHYLLLTEDDMVELGAVAKCAPPLRSTQQRDELWQALLHGEVDTIGSDHSPCPPDMKRRDDFFTAWGGISGVQHALPLMYSAATARGMALERIATLLSAAPACLFGLADTTGRIESGLAGDLCLLVPARDRDITAEELLYRHRQSPYVGRPLAWRVARTWVAGRPVFPFGR